MAKYITDFIISKSTPLTPRYQLIDLLAPEGSPLDEIKPGQFVQIKIDNGTTFLRRPISIHDVNQQTRVLTILVCRNGDGTNTLCNMPECSAINMLWPLGNNFTIPQATSETVLLVGGGVGVAPLLHLGKTLRNKGFTVNFLLAARTATDLLQLAEFKKYGTVYLSTDDGSIGEKGLITQNSVLDRSFDHIYCCGPMPMMKAVSRLCRERGIDCEVSLENVMACGIGACLCCVEKTVKGNRCVCTEGPVFNIDELTW